DMDQLKEGIGLRSYAQRDPMVEYKTEGHARFEILIQQMYASISDRLQKLKIEENTSRQGFTAPERILEKQMAKADYKRGTLETGVSEELDLMQESAKGKVVDSYGRALEVKEVSSGAETIGRNDPCPCGSGKKYKYCHGK
ncbi:MAG TPA: SEC-C metal-binding domain-containing protein, partial [bacterium]|nr:SEC-C metal-binding domain-containing protein [bacterium]